MAKCFSKMFITTIMKSFFSVNYTIINFISNDGGVTWNASFTVRGYGVSHGDCDGIINIGSCCYFP